MPMLKLAAPIATLIGLLILFFFRKKFILGIDRKAQVWWGILGALLGASCPVIGIYLSLRYPYYGF